MTSSLCEHDLSRNEKSPIQRKAGKSTCAFGCLFGAVFVAIGLFVIIPMTSDAGGFGAVFGFIWTAAAVIATIYHAANAFSDKGISVMEVECTGAESHDQAGQLEETTADRLRELEKLRDENLITEVEFESKRREILQDL